MNSSEISENADTPDASLTDALAAGEAEFVTGEEKKKLSGSTLVMGAMVLAAIGATYFMVVKAGPKEAMAKTETVAASATINQFLSDRNKNLQTMKTMLRDTEEVVKQFQAHPTATQVPLDDLATNPFRAGSEMAKTDENEAAIKRKREADRAAALAAVQNLGLQSVTFGTTRRSCMLNSKVYTEGETVDSFVVERIKPKSVIVRKDIYRYEISMARND